MRQAKGGRSLAETNAEGRRWLTIDEEATLVAFASRMAEWGWPLSLKHLEEHANSICLACHDDFTCVGHNWASRFVEWHAEKLKMSWTSPLNDSRAHAGNPHTKKAFFDLLKSILDGTVHGGDPIPPELIYGADEMGIQQGLGCRTRVIGNNGKKFSIYKEVEQGRTLL